MKQSAKKIIVLLLAAALVFGALPVGAGADSTNVCFTSVNDRILELSLAPVASGGMLYVPAQVFTRCGIYYSYFSASETAQLYTSSKNIFFDIANGTAYDENRNNYAASGFLRNGLAYMPVAWVCGYFGLSYSYINGKGYGDILRITTGAQVLTDDNQFLSAASTKMQSLYEEAYGATKNDPPPGEETDRYDTVVTVSFIGLPDEDTLQTLFRFGYRACFFITEAQAQENTDLLRQITASGHSLGIYCTSSPDTSVFSAQSAVFRATQLLPTLLYSSSGYAEQCRSYATSNAMAYFSPDYTIAADATRANAAISELSRSGSDFNFLIDSVEGSGSYLSSLLNHLKTNEYTVLALRETSF